MANHLDLEEQEQLDQLKHFWNQYGNAITWCLIAALSAVAAWNGYQYWQRMQAAQAAAMYDEIEKISHGADPAKLDRALGEMKDRFASTSYAQQAALVVAKAQYESGQVDSAKSALSWVAEKASDKGYVAIARLRLASIQMDAKAFDQALKTLDTDMGDSFAALRADRRGDIFLAQGKKLDAKTEYLKAYKGFDERVDYRRLVEVKLSALGAYPGDFVK